MSKLVEINSQSVSVVTHLSIPVVTTEMLAKFYGTDVNNIKVNHSRNAMRFVEGKHYFKLEGLPLKDFKNKITLSNLVHKQAKHLVLWTERGAARHAKMLDTDQAWDVFEKLEDCYFTLQEELSQQTTTLDREPLNKAIVMLVAKTGILYSDAYRVVHQRFNVEHTHQLTPTQLSEAVSYVHWLVVEKNTTASPKKQKQPVAPHLDEFQLMYGEFRKQILKYMNGMEDEVTRLGGKLPAKPDYDGTLITECIISYMVEMTLAHDLFGYQKVVKQHKMVQQLTEAVLLQNFALKDMLEALRQINQQKTDHIINNFVLHTNELAAEVSEKLEFRNFRLDPLVNDRRNVLNFSNGKQLMVNPNWFNYPA